MSLIDYKVEFLALSLMAGILAGCGAKKDQSNQIPPAKPDATVAVIKTPSSPPTVEAGSCIEPAGLPATVAISKRVPGQYSRSLYFDNSDLGNGTFLLQLEAGFDFTAFIDPLTQGEGFGIVTRAEKINDNLHVAQVLSPDVPRQTITSFWEGDLEKQPARCMTLVSGWNGWQFTGVLLNGIKQSVTIVTHLAPVPTIPQVPKNPNVG